MQRGLALMTKVAGALMGTRKALDLAVGEAAGDTKLPLHFIVLKR